MGYRWHEGRLISDEEYYNSPPEDLGEYLLLMGKIVGFLISLIGLGYLGYEIGGKWIMLIGLAIGGWLGYVLNHMLALIFKWTFIIGIIGGIVALLVMIFMSI